MLVCPIMYQLHGSDLSLAQAIPWGSQGCAAWASALSAVPPCAKRIKMAGAHPRTEVTRYVPATPWKTQKRLLCG